MQKALTLLVLVCLTQGCFLIPDSVTGSSGKFMSDVINLEAFNSEYDDYNSALPMNKYGEMHLIFSSKRTRKTAFNLTYYAVDMRYNNQKDYPELLPLTGSGSDYHTTYAPSTTLADRANGNFNVLGPQVISFTYDLVSYGNTKPDPLTLFYADDSNGNLDIRYTSMNNGNTSDPQAFSLLNSEKDDAYPTFSYLGDRIYFCSNRDGNFDIYEVTIPHKETERPTLESLTKPAQYTIRKVTELSTPNDDKCPYLLGNTMVFVSDRPGGKGGFDIYYSTYSNGKWSEPVNAGDRINSKYNEYRPILPRLANFSYPLMIFSSDRPGGKGGYDLYMTGLVNKSL